jgi:cytochrome b561
MGAILRHGGLNCVAGLKSVGVLRVMGPDPATPPPQIRNSFRSASHPPKQRQSVLHQDDHTLLGSSMTKQLQYGTTAKYFHWTIVALLLVQFPIGWLMSGIHRGMTPGSAMTFHVSIGIVILMLIVMRFAWRLTHPVPPENSPPAWQRIISEGVHWLLYALVLATTLSGWLYASMRGWSITFFFILRLPMLTAPDSTIALAIGGLHATAEWILLVFIGLHVTAALAHAFVLKDRVMQRMLP